MKFPGSRSRHTACPVAASRQVMTPWSASIYSRPSTRTGEGVSGTSLPDTRQATCESVTSAAPSGRTPSRSGAPRPVWANTSPLPNTGVIEGV